VEEPTPAPAPKPLRLPRLLVVAAVVALGQLWLTHHVGWGAETPWVAALLVLLTGIDWALGKALPDDRKKALDAAVRDRLVPLLTSGGAMMLCAAVVLAALVVSSLTVIPGGDIAAIGRSVTARLSTLEGTVVGERVVVGDSSGARFSWLRTSPFGHAYRLAVDGYLEETVTVYPLIGVRITPERDLRRSPSLLLRPPVAGVQSLASGGKLTIRRRSTDAAAVDLAPPQTGHTGSVLVGRAQPIPAANVMSWRLELSAARMDEAALSAMMVGWQQPRVVAPATPLAPGMAVTAEICSRAKLVVARAEVVLGTEALIDVPLLAVSGGGCQ
jgi:hypothetical protein